MSDASIKEILSEAADLRILCVGDLMLDRFIYGTVARISPEAPVPIMKLGRTVEMPGGAGNVARNVAALGAEAVLIGVVGDDAEGRALADLIGASDRVSGDLIVMKDRPTTLKTRFVAGGQQLLRTDVEDASAIDPASEAQIIAAIRAEARSTAVILVSDYAKGLMTPSVMNAILDLRVELDIPVIVDPKGTGFGRYGAVDLIKPNAAELAAEADRPGETDEDIAVALDMVLSRSPAHGIVVTRAARGMSFAQRGTPVAHRQGTAREVFDVSGAGDTSLAALGIGLAATGDLARSVELAILASGIAVGKAGTASVSASEIVQNTAMGLNGARASHVPLDMLLERVAAWREAGLTIGFTNGCFDILHPGHLRVLEEARARCGRLVVGLNADASVRRLKGPTRPVNDEVSRARVLSGLSCVDAVVLFGDDTPAELIAALGPDLLVKGGDYRIEDIVGAKDVIAAGGTVHIVPLVEGQSTTAAIARAKGEIE